VSNRLHDTMAPGQHISAEGPLRRLHDHAGHQPCEFTAILRWVCHGSEKCS
jgi:hypothetical protein